MENIFFKISYIYIFLFSFSLSCFLIPILKKLAIKFDMVDEPGERKIHDSPVPVTGGIGIYISFVFTIVVNLFIIIAIMHNESLKVYLPKTLIANYKKIRAVSSQLLAVLIGSTIMFFTGLWDDLKNLSPYKKLTIQIISALILIFCGIRTTFLPGYFLNFIVTLGWIIGITNAFNLLDNMDGLSSGVALISSFVFLYVVISQGQHFCALILLTFMGSIMGFLRYNFNPASIFMGDSGSLFIGFVLASITILSSFYKTGHPTFLPVLMPLLILGVPIFDTLSVILIRLKNNKPIFKGDTNHLSHRLVKIGFSKKGAVLAIYILTLVTGISAIQLTYVDFKGGLLLIFQEVLIFILIALLMFPRLRR